MQAKKRVIKMTIEMITDLDASSSEINAELSKYIESWHEVHAIQVSTDLDIECEYSLESGKVLADA
jgi:predicted transcriptional regulator